MWARIANPRYGSRENIFYIRAIGSGDHRRAFCRRDKLRVAGFVLNFQLYGHGLQIRAIVHEKIFRISELSGIVAKASEYIYSIASNYVNDSGLLSIEKVVIPIVDVLNLNNFAKYNEY